MTQNAPTEDKIRDVMQAKVNDVVAAIIAKTNGLDYLMSALDRHGISGRLQIGKFPFPTVTDQKRIENARTAIILDTETTGLDNQKDKVFQLAMLRVLYDEQGIIALGDRFNRLRDPGLPIPKEVTILTGYTDEMVKDQAFSDEEVAAFIAGADKVIAHHANFDRKMAEASFPGAGFDLLSWDCSVDQIDWKARAKESAKLGELVGSIGMDFKSHDAMNDVEALAWVLNDRHPETGVTAFAEMHLNGQKQILHIMAEGSPIQVKDLLKERGYRWSPDGADSHGVGKVWHRMIEVTDETMNEEAEFLRTQIYRKDVALKCFELGPENRYSSRSPRVSCFATREIRDTYDALRLRNPVDEPEAVAQPALPGL